LAVGTVVWFTKFKGYGFIRPNGGGPDMIVHMSAVERAGLEELSPGQTVAYEVVKLRGKNAADHLSLER
jgi:cold shock protein